MCVFKRLFIFYSKIQNLEVVVRSWKMRVLKRSSVFYNKTQLLETVPKRSFVLLQRKKQNFENCIQAAIQFSHN